MTTPETTSDEWVSWQEAAAKLGLRTVHEKRQFRRAITRGYVPAMKITKNTIRIHMPTVVAKFTTPTKK